MRALFLGRFQPLQNGHMHVIRDIAKQYDDFVIAIGSSQEERTKENPFSLGERKLMIVTALAEEGIGNYEIIGIPDIGDNDKYVAHVEKLVGKFDAFDSGNELTKRLFSEKGYDVKALPRYDDISATEIRKHILEGERWRTMVPKAVALILDRIDAKGILGNVR